MGLVLDSDILIAAYRRGETIDSLMQRIHATWPDYDVAISVITALELTHGLVRMKSDNERLRNETFLDLVLEALVVKPVTLSIAQLAGRIEGEQAAKGIIIPFEDLLIGTTALASGDAVVTSNRRHMKLIPDLVVLPF